MDDDRDRDEIILPEGGASRADPAGDRRAAAERRRYNRRTTDSTASPPYFEAFDRIAHALEDLEHIVAAGLGVPDAEQEARSERR